MKRIMYTLFLLGVTGTPSQACPVCNKNVADGIYDSQFYPNLAAMLSAFIVLAGIVGVLAITNAKAHAKKLDAVSDKSIPSPVPLITAS